MPQLTINVPSAQVQRLKDWIDRRFMARFQVLSPDGAMTEAFEKLPDMSKEMEMLCGGCAARPMVAGASAHCLQRPLSSRRWRQHMLGAC